MPYKPTMQDIMWAKELTRMVNDGGTWVWPDKMGIFLFDKEHQVLRVGAWGLADDDDKEMTTQTFAAIGWTVTEGTGSIALYPCAGFGCPNTVFVEGDSCPACAGVPHYIACFRAQQVSRGRTVMAKAQGPREWNCTGYLGELLGVKTFGIGALTESEIKEKIKTGWLNYGKDLKNDPAAPEWIRKWTGPFTISVRKQKEEKEE